MTKISSPSTKDCLFLLNATKSNEYIGYDLKANSLRILRGNYTLFEANNQSHTQQAYSHFKNGLICSAEQSPKSKLEDPINVSCQRIFMKENS